MDWAQFTTLICTMIAGGYTLHSFLRSDIKEFKQELKQDMQELKQDMIALDDKFDRRMIALEERFDRRMEAFESDRRHTDEKWERLFERLLIQDKARA